jgi:hypothetical protein
MFNAFGTTLSLLAGNQLGVTTSPNPVVRGFPHLPSTPSASSTILDCSASVPRLKLVG